MVRNTSLVLGFLLLVTSAYSQKVKYKDLFVLLNAKQYDQAEPFLKTYLKANDDNPNAYLFMGIIYQEKANANDILTETEQMITNLDSAAFFYDKAYKGIDEKEVRKNDEYYQAYNRRDLRTGKFGVTLSDVQFDLEKKITGIKERTKLIVQLKKQFVDAESFYSKAHFLYSDLQLRYGTLKALYLRSNDSTIQDLKRIGTSFDSSMLVFTEYKATTKQLGKTGYDQAIDLKEINSLEKDGGTLADFKEHDLKIWDYKTWSKKTIEGIEKEIVPLRNQLISYDIEINKLREKLRKDSVSVKEDVAALQSQKLYDQLKKYDQDPLPLDVFAMKTAELEYLSELINHKSFKDSANIKLQMDLIQTELAELSKLNAASEKLTQRDLEKDGRDYKYFITNAYGTSAVLKSLIKTTKDFGEREKVRKEKALAQYQESLRWIVTATDSIPLFIEVSDTSKFKPLLIENERFTAGLIYKDSLATGYFQTIIPSRKPDVSATFKVDQVNFVKRKLPVIKAIASADDNNQVFYILFYSEEKVKEKVPATLVKIYRTDGLAWSVNFLWDHIPRELTFAVESGEVSIKTSNPAGESKMIYVDKNGKQVQQAK